MVQLICELLIIGVPPRTIPSSIYTVYETLFGFPPKEVPCVKYTQQCRTIIQVIGETIAAVKLARAENWVKLSIYGTSRIHIPFQCLIISLMGDDMEIDPVIFSSCIFLDDEPAQSTVESIFNKVCLSLLFLKFSTIHIDVIFVLSFSI